MECINCGACCCYFHVLVLPNDTVPRNLTDHVIVLEGIMENDYMKGSYVEDDKPNINKRCIALEGEVGKKVKCKIYENRPFACRQFEKEGKYAYLCEEARKAHGII